MPGLTPFVWFEAEREESMKNLFDLRPLGVLCVIHPRTDTITATGSPRIVHAARRVWQPASPAPRCHRRDGQLSYAQACGDASRSRVPAKPEMRYAIGSIGKQFTAAACSHWPSRGS